MKILYVVLCVLAIIAAAVVGMFIGAVAGIFVGPAYMYKMVNGNDETLTEEETDTI